MFIFLFLHSCINLCNFFLYLGIIGGVYRLIYERKDSLSIASEITRINNNVAAAYSVCESKGADMPQQQNSSNLADTIDSIPSGRDDDIASKYINFVDYDGTILYAYSQNELQAITELPPLPQREGMICTGWNRTLLSLKENDLPDIVGAIYSPADGATKLIYEF